MNWIPSLILAPEKVERFLKSAEKNFSPLRSPSNIALHVEEPDAYKTGAPQNIELLHRLLNASLLPVHYAGGVSTVHIAELLFTLGVSKVVLEAVHLTKPERAAHFVGRFGENCVPRVRERDFPSKKSLFETVDLFKKAGFSRIIYKLEGTKPINDTQRTMNRFADAWGSPWWLEVPFIDSFDCNAEALSRVNIEAIIAPVERFLGAKKMK
ncbi:MAG TPA: HisA/HisF-related TIM barrel protein [Fimbriimonadales bacterium]|nr:HisA/HisF-related TIM barrel protein [Fimbriimonadales bacterium]